MSTPSASHATLHAESLFVSDPAECSFYHTMDLPGIGTVDGCWDLRETIDAYLGHFDFSGKHVLDVGMASGYLSFEMEKRGAQVTSFDMASGDDWNLVPYVHPDFDLDEARAESRVSAERIQNSYWFAHRLLGSSARVHLGNIYDLPAALGTFDVAMFGMILGHLRDPFLALSSVSRLIDETMIITNQSFEAGAPKAHWMPRAATRHPRAAWWALSEECLAAMLDVVGFEVQSITRSEHQCEQAPQGRPPEMQRCSTLIARRVRRSSSA